MSDLAQAVRDNFLYGYGYLQGRLHAVPTSLVDFYGRTVAGATRLLTLPLPLLSFLALPLYGGSSTTINLVFFYLTWSALVLSHSPLTVELYGTLAIRLFCFLLPALGFLAFDCGLPKISKGIKAQGSRHLPLIYDRNRIFKIAGVAVANVLLSVVAQAALEQISTRVLHLRSLLRVTTVVPLPWTMAGEILRGLVVRSVAHYLIHRFLIHTYDSVLRSWHLTWQHSVDLPFSLVAAYDHPVVFLLNEWLPAFLPAYLFRWHVLTWHLFLAIISLEELFVFSGYSVLPSSIILAGMARRTEAHFVSVTKQGPVGNFGYLGLMDFLVGSTCKDEVNVLDDALSEADKHNIQQRIESAVDAAISNVQQSSDSAPKESSSRADIDGEPGSKEQEDEADETSANPRRGLRRKVRKG